MTTNFTVKLGLDGLTPMEVVERGRAHVLALTGNLTYPTPTPALAAITTASNALETAEIAVTNNGGRFEWRDFNGALVPGEPPASHKGGMIQRVDIATGKVETVYDNCDGKTIWAPNDLVFDKQGGFWFTDHARPDGDILNYGGLYYAKADGSHIERARPHMISPNGVGLSPDEKVVYVADTSFGRLWAHDISEPGKLAPGGLGAPGRVVHNLQGGQLLDSLAVEEGGGVAVATILNGGITVFAPDGSGTEHFPFDDFLTTNICFGGADMKDAWVTCSSSGKLYKARWPRPGLKLNFNA